MSNVIKVLIFVIPFGMVSQPEGIAGDYEIVIDATNGHIRYELSLKVDGSFYFMNAGI